MSFWSDLDDFSRWYNKKAWDSTRKDGGYKITKDTIGNWGDNSKMFQKYENETGNDSKNAKKTRDVARVALIAFGAYNAYAGGGAGAGAGASSGGGGAGAGASSGGGGAGAGASSGGGGGFGWNESAGEVASGYGGSGAEAGSGFNWRQMGQGVNQMGQAGQQPQQAESDAEEVDFYTLVPDPNRSPEFYSSSRGLKRPASAQDAVDRGVRGESRVDQNGVHLAALQELAARVEKLQQAIAARKKQRGSKA